MKIQHCPLLFFFVFLILSPPAHANHAQPGNMELTEKECGACHYYYSPKFMPAYSWKLIVDTLSDHFGDDASLDEASTQRILAYLTQGRSTVPPANLKKIPIHITNMVWWRRAHGTKFIEKAAQDKITLSNCANCHGLWKLSPVGGGLM